MKTVVKDSGEYDAVVGAATIVTRSWRDVADEARFLVVASVGIAAAAATIAATSWKVDADGSPFLVVAVVGIAVGVVGIVVVVEAQTHTSMMLHMHPGGSIPGFASTNSELQFPAPVQFHHPLRHLALLPSQNPCALVGTKHNRKVGVVALSSIHLSSRQ